MPPWACAALPVPARCGLALHQSKQAGLPVHRPGDRLGRFGQQGALAAPSRRTTSSPSSTSPGPMRAARSRSARAPWPDPRRSRCHRTTGHAPRSGRTSPGLRQHRRDGREVGANPCSSRTTVCWRRWWSSSATTESGSRGASDRSTPRGPVPLIIRCGRSRASAVEPSGRLRRFAPTML